MVYKSFIPPPPPKPNPYSFTATIPAGAPGEQVAIIKCTPGAAFIGLAPEFQYAIEVEAMFAGASEDPERLLTAFACAAGEVSRVAGYHTRREHLTTHWDGTTAIVSIVRFEGLGPSYTGFLTSKHLTHNTSRTMLV